MSGSVRVFGAESYRLLRLRSTWGGLGVLGIVSAMRASFGVLWGGASSPGVRSSAGALESELASGGEAWAPFVDGWSVGLTLGTLFLLAFAARAMAGDREAGVLRLAATRSASRPALVLGRALLGIPAVLSVLFVTGLGAWFVAVWAADFGPLVEDGYELYAAEELRAEVARTALATLPALFTTFVFGLLVGALAPSASSAVLTSLGAFLAFDLFKEGIGEGAAWCFAYHVPSTFDTSLWEELAGVARGFSDAVLSDSALRAAWIAPWPALFLFLLLAVVAMRRRAL